MNDMLDQVVSAKVSSGSTEQKVYVSHSMLMKERSEHKKLIIQDPKLNWVFVSEILVVLLARAARKTNSFKGPEMDIILTLIKIFNKMNIRREQHDDNVFKNTRSCSTTNTPAFMLTTPTNRIDDLSSIIDMIMKLHTTVFSRKTIENSFVNLMPPSVASQIFETEKNKVGNNISDDELAVVFTKKPNRTFTTSPDIVFNIEFEKFMCDFDIKQFLIKYLVMMSFKGGMHRKINIVQELTQREAP